MYIASTRDDDPVDKLRKLSAKSALPAKFKNGVYSSEMHKVFILLHDKHDVDLRSRVQYLFQNVCQSFEGQSCKLLHLNSNALNDPNLDPIDLWEQYINQEVIDRYPSPKSVIENFNNSHCKRSWSKAKNHFVESKTEKHGAFLSDQDVAVLTQFVSDFAVYGVLPFIEKKMSSLYQSIAKQRRGTINRLTTWIRSTKPKPHIEERKNRRSVGPVYQLHTIESQIRQLADLSFILQQYHLALDHYKLCHGDYENDGCKKYLAGCLEMSGLCCALLSQAVSTPSWMRHDGANGTPTRQSRQSNASSTNGGTHSGASGGDIVIDRREMEKYFDQSFRAYCDISTSSAADKWYMRLGTRACIWAWQSHSSLGHSFNNDMISNVLLRPSEKEKKHRSAMLLEQAAFAYLRAGQDRSPCIRKYAFHLILAAHLYKECEQKEHSIRCYSRAIIPYADRGWSHVEDHINYNLGYLSSKVLRYQIAIEYFLELLGEGRGSATRQKNFLEKFIAIISKWPNNNQLIVQQIGLLSSHSIAKSLKFVPNLNIPKFSASEILIVVNDPNLLQTDYCIVGEPIIVQFPIHNPLKRPLVVNNLCLHIDVLQERADRTLPDMLGYDDLFSYQPSNITLRASETKLFALSIIPKLPDLRGFTMKLVGIRWQVFNCMQGFYRFETALREIRRSSPLSDCSFLKIGKKSIADFQKDHRSVQHHLRDSDSSLNLTYTVQQPIAHVVCSFDSVYPFPETIYEGELCPVVMECSNISQSNTAHRFQLTMNTPSFITVCDLESNELFAHNDSNNVVEFDRDIEPQQCLKLLIWIYGAKKGRHLIQCHFRYSTMDDALQRTTTLSRYLTVNPFMKMSPFTKDHFGDINQFILGVEVQNDLSPRMLAGKGCSVDITTIQLRDMTEEEKQNVILPPGPATEEIPVRNVISIEYVGCHSSRWRIEKLIDGQSTPSIESMSSLTSYLKLTPCDEELAMSVVYFGERDRDRDGDGDNVGAMQCADALDVLNPLNAVCQNMFRLKQQEHEKKQRHIARVFRQTRHRHKNELELIVSFKIRDGVGVGTGTGTPDIDEREKRWFHGRFGYLLLRQPFVFERNETTSNCPLRVALKYPKQLPIDADLPIKCNVQLMVLNTGSKYVTFVLETLKQNEEFDSHARSFIINDNPSARSKYKWVGGTRFEDQILDPGGYSSYDLQAQFNQPGIYNLNRYRFSVQQHSTDIMSIKKSTPSKIFFFPTQHLIVVGSRRS